MSVPQAPIQLAGHVGAFTKLDGGRIRKLVKKEEAAFYSGLAGRQLDPAIAPYIPKFFGLEEHDGKRILTPVKRSLNAIHDVLAGPPLCNLFFP
jgi:hypothetical protein